MDGTIIAQSLLPLIEHPKAAIFILNIQLGWIAMWVHLGDTIIFVTFRLISVGL